MTSEQSDVRGQQHEKAPQPQLLFDDGSRIIMASQHQQQQQQPLSKEDDASSSKEQTRVAQRRNSDTPIHVYYEIDRLADEIIVKLCCSVETKDDDDDDDGWSCRVALQFPDELLSDSPLVCWAMEDALRLRLQRRTESAVAATTIPPLVFVLGDTTFGPCCPDQVSALHLNANVLVHYGHACLSPATSLPVLYSFGVTNMNAKECARNVLKQVQQEQKQEDTVPVENVLLLYEVRYHHAMDELEKELTERGGLRVVVGKIPQPCAQLCSTADDSTCDQGDASRDCDAAKVTTTTTTTTTDTSNDTFVVGGLELPSDVDLSSFTLLFVGDDNTNSRQYVNIMLRFLSMPSGGPLQYWTYSPSLETLQTSLPPLLQRQLNRRFYLTQKARDASVYGILIGTLSQRHFQSAVSTLEQAIQDAGKSSYTFAVGKINGAKLANFGEIDCFVLVACGENSLLDNERDLHVPVITPLELDIALGNVEWGTYSLDYNDFLANKKTQQQQRQESLQHASLSTARKSDDDHDDDEDHDAPYFSLVSGKYVDSKRPSSEEAAVDLSALPGKGQVAMYKSDASNYLKNREYQGLQTNLGQDKAHAAAPGQVGIASDYGNR